MLKSATQRLTDATDASNKHWKKVMVPGLEIGLKIMSLNIKMIISVFAILYTWIHFPILFPKPRHYVPFLSSERWVSCTITELSDL